MPETIVALATPLGRSGIGVIRLSGDDALSLAVQLGGSDEWAPRPRRQYLRALRDIDSGEILDEALVTYFRTPNSFTGEDVVEISCHGSPVLLRLVIDACLRLGARMAEPGEFSLRALANGRIDLTEAEAIRDLIDAQTATAVRQSVRQMRGELSQALQPLKVDLLNVIVVLESALEFVEDDLPDVQLQSVIRNLTQIRAELARLAGTFEAGHLVRDGLRVIIAGRPNAGKSSIFNALLGSERAIVTEVAGTTRDQLHERLTIGGIPVSLVDTAGLRETQDMVESIGVDRARAAMADADLVVVIIDAAAEFTSEDREILSSVADLRHIVVLNKIDKLPPGELDRVAEHIDLVSRNKISITSVSAKTGEGLQELKRAMLDPFSLEDVTNAGFLVTDARHHDLLVRSADEIGHSLEQIELGLSEEIVLIGLHNALRFLGEITGETNTEEMLTRIFSTFCIGK
jgi:tRNA modification GTPase